MNLVQKLGQVKFSLTPAGTKNPGHVNAIHDRVLFADDRVWVIGQSIKDAAKKKPTYIIEHGEPLMRGIYEGIWQAAKVII
jgi:hypothetical protein